MEFESFDEGTLYTLEFRRRNSTCRFSRIIGDEGEDVTALIAAKSEPKIESEC
jgi:hypothetical protein